MPDLPPTQSNEAKWFTEGGNGVSPSWPGSTWFNIIQAEMLNVLAAASITPDKENLSQLSEAIQHLITSGVPDLKDASLTQKGIVQLSNATNSNSEILAATPKAVSDLGALLLKITNNLSEIKDAGPAAVAQTLANLGLGEAAKRGVGTETNDIPDIAISDKRYIKVNAENTRLWVSNEYTPVNNTMTISAHGLTGLNLLRCKCDVVLKRAVTGDGYAVGDVALSASLTINAVSYHTLSVTPSLSLTDIRLFTPVTDTGISGIEFINRTTGALVTNSPVSNWRYIFRIWY
ncbi:TPA: tail fiber protein [Yersinia enterocolitica]|nr:tail fiber protein [Yersinia enterocolitica]HDV0805566.1 tail fiber protein [Yersinia enterocolitica]HDZ9667974.1 tail fiber protein [Yersinia enterocolitica]